MPSKRYDLAGSLRLSLFFAGFLFASELVDQLGLYPLDSLGILPRTLIGLRGILFAPLLHANFTHLLANTVPLIVLLALLGADERNRPCIALASIWFFSGLGTWIIGRGGAVHLGASSVIFGAASFLIVAGWMAGSWRAILVSCLVLFAFGGIFHGVLPQQGHVSWEGHLSGAVSGVMTARSLFRR